MRHTRESLYSRIDRERATIIDTLCGLVRTRPVNYPERGMKPPSETAHICCDLMERIGFKAMVHERNGYFSALGVLDTDRSGPTVVMEGHLDVVPGAEDQFEPRVTEERIIGRGALDMLCSVPTSIAAIKAIQESDGDLGGKLYLALGADEETGGMYGIGHMATLMDRPDHVIGMEPTDLGIVVRRRAMHIVDVRFPQRLAPRCFIDPCAVYVRVDGHAVHSSHMWKCRAHAAVNAARFLEDIRQQFNVGVLGLRFGDVKNRTPEHCDLKLVVGAADLERLGVPYKLLFPVAAGVTDEGLEHLLRAVAVISDTHVPQAGDSEYGVAIGPNVIVNEGSGGYVLKVDTRVMTDHPSGVARSFRDSLYNAGVSFSSLDIVHTDRSIVTSPTSVLFRAMERNLRSLRKSRGEEIPATLVREGAGQSDLRYFPGTGAQCIEVGPRGNGAHARMEYVETDSLTIHAKALAATLLDLMGDGRATWASS